MDDATPERTLPENYLSPATLAVDRLLRLSAHGGDGPDDAIIHAIHRGPSGSGYIPLAVKDDGREWRELGAMQIGQPFLPGLLAALAHNGYFGLNSSFTTGRRFTTQERWTPIPGMSPAEELKPVVMRKPNPHGLPWAQHETKTLRWLNVAYADLDCYKLGLDVGQALGAIVSLQDRGEIPPATLFARSGRGLWAFWFLLDTRNPKSGTEVVYGQPHDSATPQRASTRAVALYARVQRAIVNKLAHLGADLGASDSPRFAPMPGTLKTTGADRVLYWAQATAHGIPAYTLNALAEQLGLELRAREHPVIESALTLPDADAGTKDATKAAAGRKGWRKRWLYALADLEILLRLRGGTFNAPHVSRNRAAFYYALTLTKSGMTPHDVDGRVSDLGARSGLEPHAITAALRQARKRGEGKHLSSARVQLELHVTDTERTYLRSRTAPAATHHDADISARRDAILATIADNGGRVPSVRQMTQHLQAHGVRGSHGTIHNDYKALGLKLVGRAGRPPKLPI